MQFREEERGAEGEAVGDAGEFLAVADAVLAEAGDEFLAEAADEGCAAGEEDGFDAGGGDVGVGQELVEVAGDLRGEVGGVFVELAARKAEVDGDLRVRERDRGGDLRGEGDLGAFDFLEEGEALVFFDEGLETFEGGGVVGESGETPEEVHFFGVSQEDDLVPLADRAVEGVGDLELFAPAVVGGAAAEERGDFVPHGGGVVFVAGDGEAAGGEDVGHAIGEALAGGVELDDGEVGGATAEVADEDALGF